MATLLSSVNAATGTLSGGTNVGGGLIRGGSMSGWLLQGTSTSGGAGTCSGVSYRDAIYFDTVNKRFIHRCGGWLLGTNGENTTSHFARLRLPLYEVLGDVLRLPTTFYIEGEMDIPSNFWTTQVKSYGRIIGTDNYPPTSTLGAGDYQGNGSEVDEWRNSLTFYNSDAAKKPRLLVTHQGVTEYEVWPLSTLTTTQWIAKRDQLVGRHVHQLEIKAVTDTTGYFKYYLDGVLWAQALNIRTIPTTVSSNRGGKNEQVISRVFIGPDGFADQDCGQGPVEMYSYRAALYQGTVETTPNRTVFAVSATASASSPPQAISKTGGVSSVTIVAPAAVATASGIIPTSPGSGPATSGTSNITFNSLGSGTDTGTKSQTETGEIVPGTNSVLVAGFLAQNQADGTVVASPVSVSGNNCTWTRVDQGDELFFDQAGVGTQRLSVWVGVGKGAPGDTGLAPEYDTYHPNSFALKHPIPSTAATHANSASIINTWSNLYATARWGISKAVPVYIPSSTDALYTLEANPGSPWLPAGYPIPYMDDLDGLQVHCPATAVNSAGTTTLPTTLDDAALVILDRSSPLGSYVEVRVWRAVIRHDIKKIYYSGASLHKYNKADPDADGEPYLGTGTGNGLSIIAGTIRHEAIRVALANGIERGAINHAIRAVYSKDHFNSLFVAPAIKTDQGGSNSDTWRMSMGMRLQLMISDAEIERRYANGYSHSHPMSKWVRMMCWALKDYGLLISDGTGSGIMNLQMESQYNAPWGTTLGLDTTFYGPYIRDAAASDGSGRGPDAGIPFARMRVLASSVFTGPTSSTPGSVGDAKTTGPITITYDKPIGGAAWSVVEATNVPPESPIIQRVTGRGNGTNADLVFTTPMAYGSAALAFNAHGRTEATTPGSGMTEIHDVTITPYASSTAQPTNPSFTTDTSGWTTTGATLARDTVTYDSSPASGKMTGVGSILYTVVSGLRAGVTYTVTCKVRRDVAWSSSLLQFTLRDGSNIATVLATSEILTDNIATGSWTTISLAGVAPSSGSMYIYFHAVALDAGQSVWFDTFSITGPTPFESALQSQRVSAQITRSQASWATAADYGAIVLEMQTKGGEPPPPPPPGDPVNPVVGPAQWGRRALGKWSAWRF